MHPRLQSGKKEIETIEEFVEVIKRTENKMVFVYPFISSKYFLYFPCLRMESGDFFYERRIPKRFKDTFECEEFTIKLAKDMGKNLFRQGIYSAIFDLRYVKKYPKSIRERDISFLLAMGLISSEDEIYKL